MNRWTAGIISGIFLNAALFSPHAAQAMPVGELMKKPIPEQSEIVVGRIQDVVNTLRSRKLSDGTLKLSDRIEHDKKVAECVVDVFDPLPNSAYQTGMMNFQEELNATARQYPSVDLDHVLVDFVVQVCGTGKLVPPKLQ